MFVRLLKTVMISMLALSWALLMSHCRLEVLPGLEFLRCQESEGACEESAGDRCQDLGCCAVESAQFQVPRQQDLTPLRPDVPAPDSVAAVVPRAPAVAAVRMLRPPEPDFPVPWQFISRAALPPRAPTAAS